MIYTYVLIDDHAGVALLVEPGGHRTVPAECAPDDMPTIHTGSFQQGACRMQDILPALLKVLAVVDPPAYEQLLHLPFGPIPGHAWEDDGAEWWTSERPYWLYNDLDERINVALPPTHMLGTHPGDGADLGIWPIE